MNSIMGMVGRNLRSLVRKYPLAIALNLSGLVCAFVAFSLIFLQADYELSFDRCHPTAQRVFRVDKTGDETIFKNVLPRGFADDIISSSSHIEAGCNLVPFFGETYFTVTDRNEQLTGGKRNLICVSERFIDVFGVDMLEGDNKALERAGSVIIPESLAKNLFPDESAIGKLLRADAKFLLAETDGLMTVTGVYKDFPGNTQLGNDLYMALGDFQQGSYGGANFICYLLLDDAYNASAVCDEFNGKFNFSDYEGWLMPIELTSLTDIYFRNEIDVYKSGSRSQLLLLIAIAILILIIGLINFTNFYLALTPLRIRSINLQKILGSPTWKLRFMLVRESVIWCLLAFVLAFLILVPVSEALLSRDVIMQTFSFSQHWKLLVFVGCVCVGTGLAAGIWPAIYSTSGEPALILRGNYSLSDSGKRLRALLVGMQFTVSIALLIFIMFVQKQSAFMKEYPCGYDRNNLAVVNIGGRNSIEKSDWLRERLRQVPEVEDVAFAMELFGGQDSYSTQTVNFGEGNVMLSMIYCSWNFPLVMGIKVCEGEAFREGSRGDVLLTGGTKEQGAKLSSDFENGARIAGFIEDLNITSLRKADSPVALMVMDPKRNVILEYAYIRLSGAADRISVSEKINEVLKEMDSAFPFELKFYDSIGKNLYSGEERLRLAVWIFSMLTVLLSLVGVWGQVLMDVQYKKTEISVKRVFGADFRRIIAEGLCLYLGRLAICFAIAAPVAWVLLDYYLRRFSHRLGFNPLIFIAAFMIVALMSSLVVLYHYLATARTNPVESLKSD